jgi:hypothetical protein
VRGKRLDSEAIARACLDARSVGLDAAAAKHGISRRSLARYSPMLRPMALVGIEKPTIRQRFDEFLRAAVDVLFEKLESADAYQTAGAIKIVGDLRIAEVALEARGMVDNGERPASADSSSRPIDVEAGPVGAADERGDARH